MIKTFDTELLADISTRVVVEMFRKILQVEPSEPPVVAEKNIIEFGRCMRVFPMEKFDGSVYVSAVNFFLTPKDFETSNPVGAFILFVKEDLAERMLGAFGRSLRESDDEEILKEAVGEFCQMIAHDVNVALEGAGFARLICSDPLKYVNSVPEGIPLGVNRQTKLEISFTYWHQKCMVVETCLGTVPYRFM